MKRTEAVAAIIKRENEVFATQRGYGEFKAWWEFPGGKMEQGETPQEADALHLNEHEAASWLSKGSLYSIKWLPADDANTPYFASN